MHTRRYSAFISYRHADNTQEGRRWAEWLHRALERYVVPPDLIGTPNLRGEPIRDSLYPIFRDEDELPANADLATGIRAALEVSDHLIVLCSPRSAVSPWVRKEVREFKELGRSDRILAIIIAGEPNADDPAKAREGILRDEECFCEELRFGAVREDGTLDWIIGTEPTAADLRPVGTRAEGFVTAEAYREHLTLNSSLTPDKIAARTEAYRQQLDHAVSKVTAGLLGVPLGQLKDRDAAHRAALAEAATARLRIFIVVITGLAIAALALAVFGLWQMVVARDAELLAQDQVVEASLKAWGTAQDVIDQGDLAKGFAHLAEALRYESHLPAQRKEPRLHEFAATKLLRSPLIPIPMLDNPPRHEGRVKCASFSHDGKRVVTGSYDQTARIWDAASGQPVGKPMRHSSEVELASFSPNGRIIVTISDGNESRLWDSSTGEPIGAPLKHPGKRLDIPRHKYASFSPDSQRVVTAIEDKNAYLWEVPTWKTVSNPLRHDDIITGVCFCPDGRLVATASEDKTIRIWDAVTGKPFGLPLLHDDAVRSVSFSPDGKQVLSTTYDAARVWDVATGVIVGDPLHHQEIVWSAAFSPDGERVVTTSNDHAARLWNARTSKQIGEPMLHQSESVMTACFSPDGQRILTTSLNRFALLWDGVTARPIGEIIRHYGRAEIESTSFSPNGEAILMQSTDYTVQLWDTAIGKPVGETLRHEAYVTEAVFSPDRRRMVTTSRDKTARIWDATNGKPLGFPMCHEDEVGNATFSPNGKWVVTVSHDNTARLWDAFTGRPQGQPMRHEGWVNNAAFSPDGLCIATTSFDKTARLWDATSGAALSDPLPHEDGVWNVSFSPDGRYIVTASAQDAPARIWDTQNGKQVGSPIRDEKNGFDNARFSQDGRRIITHSRGGGTLLWDALTGKYVGPLSYLDAANAIDPKNEGGELETEHSYALKLDRPPSGANASAEDLCFFAGVYINEDGQAQNISLQEQVKWRRRLQGTHSTDIWETLLRWKLSDPRTRTITYQSKTSTADYIEREVTWALSHLPWFQETYDLSDRRLERSALTDLLSFNPNAPLVHLGLAAIEENQEGREFLIDYGLGCLSATERAFGVKAAHQQHPGTYRAKAAIILWIMKEESKAKSLFGKLIADCDPKRETWAKPDWVNQLWDFEWPRPFREALLEMAK